MEELPRSIKLFFLLAFQCLFNYVIRTEFNIAFDTCKFERRRFRICTAQPKTERDNVINFQQNSEIKLKLLIR